jgi:Haemolysin-III related
MLVPPFFWRGFFFGPFSTTVARGLGEQVPVQLAVKSKAERGYARRVSPGVMPDIFGTCSSAQRRVCLGLIGAVTIVVISVKMDRIEVAPILVYVIGLVTMLAFSAAYNMWPVSPAKWVLRRFDHSAIYLS